MASHDVAPASDRRWARSPTTVKDRARAAPHQHPPVHLGQFLGLVDNDVPVGPVPVRGGAFDEFPGIALEEAIRQVLAVEQVLGKQVVLVVHQVLAADHVVQHSGGVGGVEPCVAARRSRRRRPCRGRGDRPVRRAVAHPTPSMRWRRRATAPGRRPPHSGARATCTARPTTLPVSRSARVRSSASVNCALSASSSSRLCRSCSHACLSSRVSQPRPIRAIARSVIAHVTISLNTARASLCGRPLARASCEAHSAISASIRIVTSASSIDSGSRAAAADRRPPP